MCNTKRVPQATNPEGVCVLGRNGCYPAPGDAREGAREHGDAGEDLVADG